jgi:hypothetical protein
MVQVAEKINCPECGGSLRLSGGEAIVTCEYCGSAVNMAVGSKYFLKHSIIPNRLAPAEAERHARSWMSGGFLKPADLAVKAKMVSMELSFVPLFVINATAETSYSGLFTRAGPATPRKGVLRKEYCWKVLGRRASDFPAREYDVPLAAKAQFSLSLLEPSSRFLNAEIGDGEAVERARQEIESNQLFLISQDVDHLEGAETKFDARDMEFLHVPVWNVRYEYRKRIYELVLDGHTGQVVKGEIPQAGGFFGPLFGG